jgi:hypothetical protein
MAAEVCFGDPNLEEPNLANSILKSVMKVIFFITTICRLELKIVVNVYKI